MPNQGGRYEIRDGKRELVHRTQPAPSTQPQAPARSPATTKPEPKAVPKPAKPAAKQPDDVTQEADHG
jgi:hypothetical protein